MRGFDSKRTCNITFWGASYGKGRNAVNTKATAPARHQFSLQFTIHNLLLRMDQSDRVPIILATIVDSDSVETSSSSLSEGAHQTRGACSSAFVWNATVHSHPVITASCASTASTDAMERKDTSGIGSSQSPYAQSPDSALMAGSSIYGRQVVFFPPPSLACAGAFDPLGNILPNYTQPVLSPFPNVPSWIPSSYPGVTTHPQTLLLSGGEASRSEQILGHGNNATLGRPIPAFPARIIAMAPNPYCPSGVFPKPTLFGPPQVSHPNGTNIGVPESMRMLPSSRSTNQKITSSLKAQTHPIEIKKPSLCFTQMALATGVRSKRKVGFALPEVRPHRVTHKAKATRAAPRKKARFAVADKPKSPGR